jgi:hypothetical protein
MTKEELITEKEKLQKDINAYLSRVDVTNPEQLPSAMLEVMYIVMSFKMQSSIKEFANVFIKKLEDQGRAKNE